MAFLKIVDQHKGKTGKITINLDPFLKKHYLKLSKPLRTIFSFSTELLIQSGYAPKGKRDVDEKTVKDQVLFEFSRISETPSLESYPDKVELETWTSSLQKGTEDEVSYIIIHNILRDQGFQIHAASYPGDQGDRKTLPEMPTEADEDAGKGQDRNYIDIIAKGGKKVFLIESKESFAKLPDIKRDIKRLNSYKTGKHLTALNRFLKSVGVNGTRDPKLAVGFFNSNDLSDDDLKKKLIDPVNQKQSLVDYAFVINKDKSMWKIIELNSTGHFSKLEGDVSIPPHFSIKS